MIKKASIEACYFCRKFGGDDIDRRDKSSARPVDIKRRILVAVREFVEAGLRLLERLERGFRTPL